MATKLTALDVRCPECLRGKHRACRGSRIPSPSMFGGGWGGPADLERPHAARVLAAKQRTAIRIARAAFAQKETV